jgi:hypothetical protein
MITSNLLLLLNIYYLLLNIVHRWWVFQEGCRGSIDCTQTLSASRQEFYFLECSGVTHAE